MLYNLYFIFIHILELYKLRKYLKVVLPEAVIEFGTIYMILHSYGRLGRF